MSGPMVSVVIPVYNGEAYLRTAVESVLQQDYGNIQLIIIDDGSTDGSAEIARSFHEAVYIRQTNEGQSSARNRGIEEAGGDLIAFLDQDDLWPRQKLRTQVTFMMDNPHLDFTLARMSVFLEEGVRWPSSLNRSHYDTHPVGYLPGTLLARRAAFEKIGDFDTSLKVSDDSEWFFRARDEGLVMAVVPEILLFKRIHDKNLSHMADTVKRELLLIARMSIERKRRPPRG